MAEYLGEFEQLILLALVRLGDDAYGLTIRDTLRNRKEQLLKAAYLAIARDEARTTNYLAQQVIEAAGKLPDAAKTPIAPKPIGH